ncbi:MAG: hypothetical protein EP329_27350 [Deltaproteobacteria bacterium]|nr:MAG: hypothetical protein EP329_27350 [Deltaproteobacteria bacterium]
MSRIPLSLFASCVALSACATAPTPPPAASTSEDARCVVVTFAPSGEGEVLIAPFIDGVRWPRLLQAPLDGAPGDELVLQVPGSCGTGACDAVVFTPCAAGEGAMREIGTLGVWGPVEALETETAGHRDLRAGQRDLSSEIYQWDGQRYVRVRVVPAEGGVPE